MVFAVCDSPGPAFDIGVWNVPMLIGKWASTRVYLLHMQAGQVNMK